MTQPKDLDAWSDLQERLIRAAYLPLPQSPASQEAGNGQS